MATKVKNIRNQLWLETPTQLLTQGQWWSNLSTHLLQIEQCLDLAVLITLQSGHKLVGWNLSSRVKKLISVYFKYPGSLQLAISHTTKSKKNPEDIAIQ